MFKRLGNSDFPSLVSMTHDGPMRAYNGSKMHVGLLIDRPKAGSSFRFTNRLSMADVLNDKAATVGHTRNTTQRNSLALP